MSPDRAHTVALHLLAWAAGGEENDFSKNINIFLLGGGLGVGKMYLKEKRQDNEWDENAIKK